MKIFLLAATHEHTRSIAATNAALVAASDEDAARASAIAHAPRNAGDIADRRTSPVLAWRCVEVAADGALPDGLPVIWFTRNGIARELYAIPLD